MTEPGSVKKFLPDKSERKSEDAKLFKFIKYRQINMAAVAV